MLANLSRPPKTEFIARTTYDQLKSLSKEKAWETIKGIDPNCMIRLIVYVYKQDPEITIESICNELACAEHCKAVEEVIQTGLSGTDDIKKEKEVKISPLLIPDPIDIEDQSVSNNYFSKHSIEHRGNKLFRGTDQEIADIYVDLVGIPYLRLLAENDSWLQWTGSFWNETPHDGPPFAHMRLIQQCFQKDISDVNKKSTESLDYWSECIARRFGCNSEKAKRWANCEREAYEKAWTAVMSASKQKSIIELASKQLLLQIKDLDNNSGEIVFNDKVWNVETNAFTKPNRDKYNTKSTGCTYYTPSEEARAEWNKILVATGLDDATLEFIKRSLGYASLGHGTAKRFWWFRGEKDTGKTTLLHIAAKALNTYSKPTSTGMWLRKTSNGSGHSEEKASLRGCRLVYADEFPMKSSFDETLMKGLTSGGLPQSASHKSGREFTFTPRCALFFTSNFDPHVNPEDEAAIGRLTAVTFQKEIPSDKKIPNFVELFFQKPGTQQAVLEWIMEGARSYHLYGFGSEPQAIIKSRKEYVESQTSIDSQLTSVLIKRPLSIEDENGDQIDDPAPSLDSIMAAISLFQKITSQRTEIPNRKRIADKTRKLFETESKIINGLTVFPGLVLRKQSEVKLALELDYKGLETKCNDVEERPN